jgi:hypothetical protein
MKSLNRETLTTLFYPALLGVALVVLIATVARTPPQSITYSQAAYQSERAVYRAGETLVVTATLTVHQPGIADARRGWRTYPDGVRATLCDGTNAPNIVNEPPPFIAANVNTDIVIVLRIPVPALPPGQYQLVSASYNRQGGEAIFVVPFGVEGACP